MTRPARHLPGRSLYILMVMSGFAGLGYEIVWTRMLAVGLGHEIIAVLAVVASFFTDLALGASAWTVSSAAAACLVAGTLHWSWWSLFARWRSSP
jgi:predicted membrane-bound spermidine synthase